MATFSMSKASVLVVAVCAITAAAVWFFYFSEPRKNVFGRPSMERLVHECYLEGGKMKVSLYRGEPGATDAYWYSVAVSEGGEKAAQIFYTYSEPEITSIECKGGELGIALAGQAPRSFSLAEVTSLKANPKGIYKGQEKNQ